MKKTIAIVIPAFNEEGNVEKISNKLCEVLKTEDFNILFVDDGSTDKTLKKLKDLHKKNPRINYLSLSRNFGHQSALKAGLDFALGDCVISMDADLQHPPELVIEMIEKWREGYEIVYTLRDAQNTGTKKVITSRLFYWIVNKLSDIRIENGAADFRLLDRKVVNVIKGINESVLFLRGLISWCGFRSCPIKYIPNERYSGRTKYSFKKMLLFAIDGITSFSIKPLRLSIYIGFLFSFVAALYGIYIIFSFVLHRSIVSGWTSMIVSILFIGGIQLIILGIYGEYLGKMFIESKKRPLYIVSEKGK